MQTYLFSSQIPVTFRDDGYLNATVIATHFNKQPRDYLKTEQTQEYISALAEFLSTKTKILVKENQLVTVVNGGNNRGTWLHPKLAVHFARWLDAKFAVWCDMKIEEILGISENQTDARINPAQKQQIREAVQQRHYRTGEHWQEIYRKLHSFLRVNSYHEIQERDFQTALNFLASIENVPVKPKEPQLPRNLHAALFHGSHCAEFLYKHYGAIKALNSRMAVGLYSHIESAILCSRDVAKEAGIKLPPRSAYDAYPWDGTYEERRYILSA